MLPLTASLSTAVLGILMAADPVPAPDAVQPFPLPSFVLPNLNGKNVALAKQCGPSAQQGQKYVLVLSFFATWCKPCMKELPALRRFAETYRDRGVRVFMIGTQNTSDDIRRVLGNETAFEVLSDELGLTSSRMGVINPKTGMGELPATFVVDGDCRVRRAWRGASEKVDERLAKAVADLVGREAGPAK
jgi:peroxiredoxin